MLGRLLEALLPAGAQRYRCRMSGKQKADDPGRKARQARLAEALRQNMKRRKAQARARTQAGRGDKAHDSAGIVAEIAPRPGKD